MATARSVHVSTPDGPMPAHQWLPDSGSGPGLLLLQEVFGVSDYIRQRGADLADLGYVVLAPEIYWRLDDAEIDETREDFLTRAMDVAGRLDWPTAVQDAAAAVGFLADQPEVDEIPGLIGFCFGGGLAFNVAAETEPSVLISYYGSALPTLLDLADRVTAPSLHHFGTRDAFIDSDTVERIRQAVEGPATTFLLHEGAGHAFDNSQHDAFFHEQASIDAWRRTVAFLAEWLPVRNAPQA
ncbi:MAG: dienelactone hydrolase family protein [Propionibacteriaceae bacterium]